jgi:Na+/H+ antiporter NhaD/arsenite permease-like protein
MNPWIAGGVFLAAYALIASERLDRTLVALLGGLAVVALGVIDQEEAFRAIDLNVIFLLAGMMVMAGQLARTGFFEWLAIRAVKLSHGEPFRLLVILALVTALLSAFLDNVTTVVLLAPVTLTIARTLGVSPYPFLVSQIMASNVGGTATLIGDPPNILIGSRAGLDFGSFIVTLGPVVLIILAVYMVTLRFFFAASLAVDGGVRATVLALDERRAIRDRRLMAASLVVVGFTILAFLFHQALHLEVATIALLGATVLMLVGRVDPHEALREVEWSTLFFFVGLFILVESVVSTGVVGGVADSIAGAAGGHAGVASVTVLWFSALASAVVDNIPYTASAIPVVERLAESGLPAEPLWWSLALGACLGGNLTIVGASANIVVANMASRAGYPIRFLEFFKYGLVVVLESLVISSVYIWLRFLW